MVHEWPMSHRVPIDDALQRQCRKDTNQQIHIRTVMHHHENNAKHRTTDRFTTQTPHRDESIANINHSSVRVSRGSQKQLWLNNSFFTVVAGNVRSNVFQLKPKTVLIIFHSIIHSGYFYRVSSSLLPLRGAPDYSIDTVLELTRWSATGNCECMTCPRSLCGGQSIWTGLRPSGRQAPNLALSHHASHHIACTCDAKAQYPLQNTITYGTFKGKNYIIINILLLTQETVIGTSEETALLFHQLLQFIPMITIH